MREDEAERLLFSVERQRRAARAVADGSFDECSTREFIAATIEESIALAAVDQAGAISPRSANPSRRA